MTSSHLALGLLGVFILGVLLAEGGLRLQRRKADARQRQMWDETQAIIRERIQDPERIASLDEVRARLGAQKAYLDMICRSTAAALTARRAVITLVDGERQTWIAHHFVEADEEPQPRPTDGMPYDQSYCQYVVASDATFAITDARTDHRVSDHPCFTILGMRAYLGTPVHSREGFPVGSLCVFDTRPRTWSERDIVTLESLAALVSL